MPDGYLVSLGDAYFDAGDTISGGIVTFTTDTILGAGEWVWTGTFGGTTYTYESEPGVYHLATDGNVYFVPDLGPVTTLSDGFASLTPTNGTVDGTGGAELIDHDYLDTGGDGVDFNPGNPNDSILAGAGNDTVAAGLGNDTVGGGDGNDLIYGDFGVYAADPISDQLQWDNEGGNTTNVAAGFTQDTGAVDVTVSFTNTGNNNPTFQIDTDDTQYVAGGEPFDNNSSVYLFGNGDGATSTTTIDFAPSAGSSVGDEVENVRFRINDVDWGSGNHTDVVTVNAYDADGNPVAVTLTPSGGDTVVGNTITANTVGDAPADAGGSVLVEIAGPVASVEIIYGNAQGGTQAIWVTDVHFDAILDEAGDDSLSGGLGNDTIFGDAGNDTLLGDGGADSLIGGAGDDSVNGGSGNDTLVGGAGNDTFTGGTGVDTLDYSASAGAVQVNLATNSVAGGDAQGDVLTGGVENVIATAQADTLTGDGLANSFAAGAGNDTLSGGGGSDTLLGEDGADTISGGTGNDSLVGGAGDDTLEGGAGADTLNAGAGMDYVSYATSTAGVTVNLTTNTFSGGHATGDVSEGGIDGIIGSGFNDSLTGYDPQGPDWTNVISGGAGDDTIDGMGGDDSLYGEAGADSILGGDGNDVVDGGTDADTLDGGLGDDTLVGGSGGDSISGGDGADFIDAGTGNDIVSGGAGNDTIGGNDGDDVIAADDGDDAVLGGSGNDTIGGGAGADTILGGADDDVISGGTGADELYGDGGNDTIFFGQGDTVSGGDGDDVFNLVDLAEAGSAGITILGGTTSQSAGDTLNLNGLADRTTLSVVDNGGGEFSGSVTMLDGTLITFSNIDNVICFTPGTRILTPQGPRPVETLRPGDLIVTRDHGPQPLRWVGSKTVPAQGHLAPVQIAAEVLPGANRPLLVSPQHRLLFEGYEAELMFGPSEVLVSAKHMIDGQNIRQVEGGDVTYIHLMLDRHEVIYAEGAATESFHIGHHSLETLSDASRADLFEAFPHLKSDPGAYGDTARLCLKRHEALSLFAGHSGRKAA
ncbi:Hint domain-containing protein [Thalassococcus sp. BH17M4-6]|uniref:Hint domain-containing protein n=1 Tax=Thalassococcus sp. BH17M4-6 TaxID=3413148 RepID=UPI003BBC63B4